MDARIPAPLVAGFKEHRSHADAGRDGRACRRRAAQSAM